jgi:hypothetical protein
VFGLLATLQNVATISSRHITPVLVSDELFVWPPAPSGCCICDVCAATGDAIKSNAAVNGSIFRMDPLRWYGTDGKFVASDKFQLF